MNCAKCKRSFQDDAVFCPYCEKKAGSSSKKDTRQVQREQNRKTYRHEKRHIDRNELNEPTYNEYGGK